MRKNHPVYTVNYLWQYTHWLWWCWRGGCKMMTLHFLSQRLITDKQQGWQVLHQSSISHLCLIFKCFTTNPLLYGAVHILCQPNLLDNPPPPPSSSSWYNVWTAPMYFVQIVTTEIIQLGDKLYQPLTNTSYQAFCQPDLSACYMITSCFNISKDHDLIKLSKKHKWI